MSPTLARSLGSTAPTAHDGVDLSALRAFGSTGEAWNEGPWWWLFDDVGGRDIPIVNLSGGTEVGACFLSVNLLQGLKPVSVGGPALGMDVDVIDASGQTVLDGLRSSWPVGHRRPGMTRGVWNDPQRYLETYWSRIPGVWVHGDWASRDADGFWYLHGRSDDTLNIAGKRIGPAEFESVAVSVAGVVAAAAVGVPDPVEGESSVLCVVAGPNPPDDLVEQVSAAVVRELGKAFKPSAVHVVDDLPRTRSAKIVRRAVKAVLLGDDPGDVSTLENPESLGALPGSPSPEEGPDR
ncbi:MAG: AMP-binding protein [Acidimicrobiales bacterium]|nr:AMP-binding protein [Acidimicrobiales bacterium]